MKLRECNLIARLYRWNFALNFGEFPRNTPSHTDLCSMMRCILIYLPLKILLYMVALVLACLFIFFLVAAFTVAYIDSRLIYWMLWSVVLGMVLVMFLAGNDEVVDVIVEKVDKAMNSNYMSTAQVVGHWIVAKKRKICPMIEIVKDEDI